MRTGHFALPTTNVSNLELRDLDIAPTRDGIDLVGSSNVYGTRLNIAGGGDDAVVLKSDYSLGVVLQVANVTLEDSSISSNGATALEIGTETVGDFSNIQFRNIAVHSAGDGAIGMAVMDGGRVFADRVPKHHNLRRRLTDPVFTLALASLAAHLAWGGWWAGSETC